MNAKSLLAATASLALAASPAAADQTVYSWNNLGGGAWTTVANWVMEDGSPASSEMKAAILAACNDEDIRPLTDQVSCEDVELVTYDINMTYYLSRDSTESAATIQANVEAAVQNFIAWEAATIGRDINPSKLNQLVIEAGAKRTVINSPTFTVLKNGTVDDPSTAQPEDYVPQMASIGTVTLVNGGYEDE